MSEHDHLCGAVRCGAVLDLPWLDSRLVITLFFSGLGRIIGKGGSWSGIADAQRSRGPPE